VARGAERGARRLRRHFGPRATDENVPTAFAGNRPRVSGTASLTEQYLDTTAQSRPGDYAQPKAAAAYGFSSDTGDLGTPTTMHLVQAGQASPTPAKLRVLEG
jgi:hypothetical protein